MFQTITSRVKLPKLSITWRPSVVPNLLHLDYDPQAIHRGQMKFVGRALWAATLTQPCWRMRVMVLRTHGIHDSTQRPLGSTFGN